MGVKRAQTGSYWLILIYLTKFNLLQLVSTKAGNCARILIRQFKVKVGLFYDPEALNEVPKGTKHGPTGSF